MKREWKPGDVALVRNEHGIWNRAIRQVALPDGEWQYGVARATAPGDAEAHALIVLDPEDREKVRALADAAFPEVQGNTNRLQAALRSLVADPGPEEPTGLGAVVSCDDGSTFVRTHLHRDGWTRAAFGGEPWKWVDLPRPLTVFSPGWEPES